MENTSLTASKMHFQYSIRLWIFLLCSPDFGIVTGLAILVLLFASLPYMSFPSRPAAKIGNLIFLGVDAILCRSAFFTIAVPTAVLRSFLCLRWKHSLIYSLLNPSLSPFCFCVNLFSLCLRISFSHSLMTIRSRHKNPSCDSCSYISILP